MLAWSSSELGALRGRAGGQHAAAQRHEDQTEPVHARERRQAAECRVQQGMSTSRASSFRTSGLDQGVLDLKCWLVIEVQPVQQMALSSGKIRLAITALTINFVSQNIYALKMNVDCSSKLFSFLLGAFLLNVSSQFLHRRLPSFLSHSPTLFLAPPGGDTSRHRGVNGAFSVDTE